MFLIMATFCFTAELQAEDKKASALIVIKNDFVEPEKAESYHKQSMTIYCHDGNWFGGGLSVTVKPKYDYTEVKPWFTLNKGPLYFLGGLSTDSSGNDYIQGGGWYINKFGKFKVFFDLRNYWNIDGESSDYLDCFLEGEYPLGKKFYVGLDLDYCHYWQDEDHNFYFVGPYVGYKVMDNLSVYLRLSCDWNVVHDNADRTDKARIGLKVTF
ncbi:hypothetical protein KAU09_03435 [Candidatus Parcubacteria bacterium]|nr:hypothetical protein [Candidatus Parcubacteria bacterium]